MDKEIKSVKNILGVPITEDTVKMVHDRILSISDELDKKRSEVRVLEAELEHANKTWKLLSPLFEIEFTEQEKKLVERTECMLFINNPTDYRNVKE